MNDRWVESPPPSFSPFLSLLSFVLLREYKSEMHRTTGETGIREWRDDRHLFSWGDARENETEMIDDRWKKTELHMVINDENKQTETTGKETRRMKQKAEKEKKQQRVNVTTNMHVCYHIENGCHCLNSLMAMNTRMNCQHMKKTLVHVNGD